MENKKINLSRAQIQKRYREKKKLDKERGNEYKKKHNISLSRAQIQKRYREKRKLDKERDNEYKKKHKERNAKANKILEMSKTEQKRQREVWQTAKKKQRNNTNSNKNVSALISTYQTESTENTFTTSTDNICTINNSDHSTIFSTSTQKCSVTKDESQKRSIEKFKKSNSILKKENENLKQKIKNLLKEKTKYQKQILRFKKTSKKDNSKKRFQKTVKKSKIILNKLKDKYKSIKLDSNKLFATKLMKRYRMVTVQNLFQRNIINRHLNRKKTNSLIADFYCRDDNSRATAGKKETVTRNKLKKQKRFLNDSMDSLYKKFCHENPLQLISYETFTRHRPFWVRKLSCLDRNTCACQDHSNINFMIDKLFQVKVISQKKYSDLMKHVMCQTENANCAWGFCNACKLFKIPTNTFDAENKVNWHKWEIINEEKENKKLDGNKTYIAKVVKKVEKVTTLKVLENEFQSNFQKFKKHYFNVKTQLNAYQFSKENLKYKENEALILIDFSENYACKLAEEVQMFHFGASRDQVSIHTGVIYLKDNKLLSFASISPNLQHGPGAIWAHLDPVLKYLKSNEPEITTVHFFSDGPSSQYRQKNNFYLLSNHFFNYEFECGTWNFFEKSHGKNAADGIGAVLKRTADSQVAQGLDITDARSFYDVVKPKVSIKLFYISTEEISKSNKLLTSLNIKTIPGTRNIHQILVKKANELIYRNLSCFCSSNNWLEGVTCDCHNMKAKKFNFKTDLKPIAKRKRVNFSEVFTDSDEAD